MTMPAMHDFIFSRLPKVKGYLDILDAMMFVSISDIQRANTYQGGTVEIGIFYGRSFFLLHYLGQDEKCLAIDLFDIGKTKTELQQYDQFVQYGAALGLRIDKELIIVGDSTKLSPGDISEKVGKVRFFSIDGGHHLQHVEADAKLAKATLADHGVIVFDDSFSPEWPEVTVGIIDFLRNNDDYRVFCITDKKLYACKEQFVPVYRSSLIKAPNLKAFSLSETKLLESTPIQIRHPIKRRIYYEMMQASGMGRMSRYLY